jgi:hypothetical protein
MSYDSSEDCNILSVKCKEGHILEWFRCNKGPNKGKIYWKSTECKSFYNNNYIMTLAPYDDCEKTVRCMGQK